METRRPMQKVVARFVDTIPAGKRTEGEILISIKYGIASLACPCGCGNAMDLPIEPHRWSIKWDGEHISMSPSISSSRTQCKSHYWITDNRILWAQPIGEWSERRKDRAEAKARRAAHKQGGAVGRTFKRLLGRRRGGG